MKAFSIVGTAYSISLSFLAVVQPASAVPEFAPNNSFAARQFLPSGTTTVNGELGLNYDFHFSDSLSPGKVDTFTIPGLSPSDSFIAFTDNTTNGTIIDTILGTFDQSGSLIKSDDDTGRKDFSTLSSFSALSGSVNNDGTIKLDLTGFPDFGFDGNHSRSGDYELFVKLGTSTLGDIDFLTFSNLLAGSPFTAKINSGTFDSILGLLDDSGNILAINDDIGDGALSLLSGTVPESGRLNLAVTGFPDFSLTGNHVQHGAYTLSLTATTVPEPSFALGMLAFGALGAGSVLKRKQRHQTAQNNYERSSTTC